MKFFRFVSQGRETPTGAAFDLEDGFTLRLDVLEPHVVRIAIVPPEGLRVAHSWMVDPRAEPPVEGRPREDFSAFSTPAARVDLRVEKRPRGGGSHMASPGRTVDLKVGRIETDLLSVDVFSDPLRLRWRMRAQGDWCNIALDRPTGAYALTNRGAWFRHYRARGAADQVFGLGDKAGPLDRMGRRLRLLQMDALGYDAETSDPLYKHWPVLVRRDGESGLAWGEIYDHLAPLTFDLGCEISNYHEPYQYAEIEERGLDLYLVAGPRLRDVVPRLTRLIGLPHMPPRWSLGFAFTTMHHADSADPPATFNRFLDRCAEERIPIGAVHFGSGYTLRNGVRCVFTWDRSRYPDPAGLLADLKARGVRLVANTKPALLTVHPAFQEVAAAGGLIRTADGGPATDEFWGGEGGFLDFTSQVARNWWREGLRAQVLEAGFDAGWNDNNEYEIWDEKAVCDGFGTPVPAAAVRPLQSLLMTRTTAETQRTVRPGERAFTVTRAGPPGVQRWAQSWTGDNRTSWKTLKWNLANGLSLALSGYSNIGHDIGGFAGPQPGPELLARWTEMMALHPRCVMNSWNDFGTGPTTVPWLYAESTPPVRAALRLRHTLIPTLYAQFWRASLGGEPILRPLFYEFEEDAGAFEGATEFLLGPDLLVAPVVEDGARKRRLRLPETPGGWLDAYDGAPVGCGEVEVDAPLGRPPLFVRSGGILLAADPSGEPSTLLAYCGAGAGERCSSFWWDDGVSLDEPGRLDLRVRWSPDGVEIEATVEGPERWPANGLRVALVGAAGAGNIRPSGAGAGMLRLEPAISLSSVLSGWDA
ncbi:MAG: hypothetical protein M3Z21_00735 [Pseudomonadota bacterium]|nr:hypothetical protein [Pseudomonadota bacterium]